MENEQKIYKEYFVVTAMKVDELMDVVEDRLKNGWQCQGGVFVYGYESGGTDMRLFYQAMVR